MGSLTEISLFSGYGGFGLGLRLAGIWARTVCYVEFDKYCQQLIQTRIRDGFLADAPIWDDAKTFDGRPWAGQVDIVTAGFPCQPHSVAGQRRGAIDERNLWPDTRRIIGEVGPPWVLLENVPGILVPVSEGTGYAGTVVGQLSEIGYDAVWHLAPTAAVGAPHLRWRWWCLATNTRRICEYTKQQVCEPQCSRQALVGQDGQNGHVAHATGAGRPPRARKEQLGGCGAVAYS